MTRKHFAITGAAVLTAGVLLMVVAAPGMTTWADHEPIPEDVDDDYLEFLEYRNYMSEEHGQTEGEFADCTITYSTQGSGPARGGGVDLSIDCGIGGSGGGGGGGSGDPRLYNVLRPDFDRHLAGITWEQTGVEFCTVNTINHARHPGHGPTTLSIDIDCWWMDDITILNKTADDRPIEELAAKSAHAVLGVVIGTDVYPYNGSIYTDVTVAVTEDLRGTYQEGLMPFRFEGGSINDTRVVDYHAPAFETGEQVIVLAGIPDDDGYYPVVGGVNGKYGIADHSMAMVGMYDRHYDLTENRATTVEDLRVLFAEVPSIYDQAQEMVDTAIALYGEEGPEAAWAAIADQGDARFHDGELYVFVLDAENVMVAHGVDPALVGLDFDGIPDGRGTDLGALNAESRTPDGVWVEYWWPNPATESDEPERKLSWNVFHDGYTFSVGVYPDS